MHQGWNLKTLSIIPQKSKRVKFVKVLEVHSKITGMNKNHWKRKSKNPTRTANSSKSEENQNKEKKEISDHLLNTIQGRKDEEK